MKTSFTALVLTLGAVIVVACGGDDDAVAPPPGGGTSSSSSSGAASSSSGAASSSSGGQTDDPVGAYANGFCEYQKKCAGSTYLELYGDDAGCRTFVMDAEKRNATLPGFSVTADQYRACAGKASAAQCNDGTLKDCEFAGTLDDGKPCGTGLQCKGGACVTKPFDVCGVCGTLGGDGAACGGSGRPDCASGFGCNQMTQKCAAPLAEGADCRGGGTPCGPLLKCIQQKCAKPLADGATCESTAQCSSQSFCNDDKKCTPLGTTSANTGDSCKDLTVACKLGSCEQFQNKCVARAAAGEDCGLRTPCKAGLSCRQGKCVADDLSTCK